MENTSILRSMWLKNIFHQLSKNWVSQILEGLFKLGKRSATTTWFLRHTLVWGIVFVWEKAPFVGRLFPFWKPAYQPFPLKFAHQNWFVATLRGPKALTWTCSPTNGLPERELQMIMVVSTKQKVQGAAPFGWKSAVERSTTKNMIALEFLWELEPSGKHLQCLFQRSDLFIYLHFMLFSFISIRFFLSSTAVSSFCGVGTSFWSRGKARVNKGNSADNKALKARQSRCSHSCRVDI